MTCFITDRVSTKSRFFRSVCHPIKRRVGGQYAVARFVRGAFFSWRWIRDTKIPPRQNYHPQWRGLENPREKGCATLGWGGKSNAVQFFKKKIVGAKPVMHFYFYFFSKMSADPNCFAFNKTLHRVQFQKLGHFRAPLSELSRSRTLSDPSSRASPGSIYRNAPQEKKNRHPFLGFFLMISPKKMFADSLLAEDFWQGGFYPRPEGARRLKRHT